MHTEACFLMIRLFANPPLEKLWRKMRKSPSLSPATKREDWSGEWKNSFVLIKKELEILFVDGGENHFSGEYRVIQSEKGRAIQMNLGAEESTGDILFFLHCDSILPKGFVKEIREGIKHSLAGCLGIRFKKSLPFNAYLQLYQ